MNVLIPLKYQKKYVLHFSNFLIFVPYNAELLYSLKTLHLALYKYLDILKLPSTNL